jgi:hypothetical protein
MLWTASETELARIADGQPINRIDELVPWRMTGVNAPQPP